ncbi:MAG: hypothetical protein M3O26_00050 [Pseudomonadota bacterium]|nr:hypothetical protein [Pseudomonadota bacterium]
MAKSARKIHIPPLPPDVAAALSSRLDEIARKYAGSFDELESALGMMTLGRLFGWKVLVLIHNKRTIKNYEEILGIKVREEFPEEGPLFYKSVAYGFIQKIGEFWKGVSGDIKIPERRTLSN